MFQLLQLVCFAQGNGVSLGELEAKRVRLNQMMWVQVIGVKDWRRKSFLQQQQQLQQQQLLQQQQQQQQQQMLVSSSTAAAVARKKKRRRRKKKKKQKKKRKKKLKKRKKKRRKKRSPKSLQSRKIRRKYRNVLLRDDDEVEDELSLSEEEEFESESESESDSEEDSGEESEEEDSESEESEEEEVGDSQEEEDEGDGEVDSTMNDAEGREEEDKEEEEEEEEGEVRVRTTSPSPTTSAPPVRLLSNKPRRNTQTTVLRPPSSPPSAAASPSPPHLLPITPDAIALSSATPSTPSAAHMSFPQTTASLYETTDLVRPVGQSAFPWDLRSAVYSSRSTFVRGEKVLVPRSSGAVTYGRVAAALRGNAYKVEISVSSAFLSSSSAGASVGGDMTAAGRTYGWKNMHAMSIGKIPGPWDAAFGGGVRGSSGGGIGIVAGGVGEGRGGGRRRGKAHSGALSKKEMVMVVGGGASGVTRPLTPRSRRRQRNASMLGVSLGGVSEGSLSAADHVGAAAAAAAVGVPGHHHHHRGGDPSLAAAFGSSALLSSSSRKIPKSQIDELQALVLKWQHGELSNFDYLMALNRLAGRRMGDRNRHPVLPWIIDFTSREGNWRDLKLSKFRMKKGDQMLDITFRGPNPHHVTEPLSEVAYYTYIARVTDVETLCKYVRTRFQPREYPSSMRRMYDWTPEECIPEFFTDPTIFKSIHNDLGKEMCDLALPEWATSAEDFIRAHRNALESDQVSRNLHHWIDLIFGYKLSGDAAILAKNVMYRKQTNDVVPAPTEFVQLFFSPHPKRICAFFPDVYQKRLGALLGIGLSASSSAQQQWRTSPDAMASHETSVLLPALPEEEGTSLDDASSMHLSGAYDPYHEMNMKTFEDAIVFSSRHFCKARYHTLPLLYRQEEFHFLSKEELFADDFFALGCLVYELYMFRPLFTTQSLEAYLQCGSCSGNSRSSSSSAAKECVLTRVRQLPMPIREMVERMIDLNATNRRKAFEFEIYNMVFPSFFKWVYYFLKGFYMLDSPEEKYAYVIRQERKIVKVPKAGFFLVFSHILNDFFSAGERMWTRTVRLLLRKAYRDKVKRCGGCDRVVKYIVTGRLGELLDAAGRSEELSLVVLHSSFIRFMILELKVTTRQFIERLLPFYLDCVFRGESPEVARGAFLTLSVLAKKEFGVYLTLAHVVEPILARLGRVAAERGPEQNATVFLLLYNVSIALSPSTLFSYLLTRLLRMFLVDYLEKQTISSEGLLITLFELLERVLTKLKIAQSTKLIDSLLSSNKDRIREALAAYDRGLCSLQLYQKIIQVVCYLMHVSSALMRSEILQVISPVLAKIFRCPFSLEAFIGSRFAARPSPSAADSSSSSSGSGTLGHPTRVRRKPRGGLSYSSMEDDQPLLELVQTHRERQPKPPPLTPHGFAVACMVYRELCCVVGNSAMRAAIANSEAFEEEIHRTAADMPLPNRNKGMFVDSPLSSLLARNANDEEFFGKNSAMENLVSYHTKHSSNPPLWWMISSDLRKKSVSMVPKDDGQPQFRGVREHTFRNRTAIRGLRILERDERLFLTYGKDGAAVWNLESGKKMVLYNRHQSVVRCAEFLAPDGCVACSASMRHLAVWDVPKAKTLYATKDAGVISFCTCPYSPHLLSTITLDGTVKFFDLRTYHPCFEWRIVSGGGHLAGGLRLSSLATDDNNIYVGLTSGSLVIMDLLTGTMLDVVKAHDREVTHIRPFYSSAGSDPTSIFGGNATRRLFFTRSSEPRSCVKTWAWLGRRHKTKLFRQYSMSNQAGITSFDMDVETSSMFAVAHPDIVGVGSLASLIAGAQRKVLLKRFNCHGSRLDSYRLGGERGSHERFTDVRYMPIHRFVMISTEQGGLHLYR